MNPKNIPKTSQEVFGSLGYNIPVDEAVYEMFVDTIYDDQSINFPSSIYHKNQPFMNQYNPKIAIYLHFIFFLDIHVRYPFVQCQGA